MRASLPIGNSVFAVAGDGRGLRTGEFHMASSGDDIASESKISETGQLQERTVQGLHHALAEWLPQLDRHAPVLDLGCGTGAWVRRLRESGFTNLTALDADLSSFSVEGVRAICGDLDHEECGLMDNEFSLITAIEVIEHLSNPGRLLQLARKHLSPDGILLITTPNIQSITARLRFLITGHVPHFDRKSDPTHVSPLVLFSFENLLSRYGLAILTRKGHPKFGSLMFRRELLMVGKLLGLLMPDNVPGDVLCLQIGRVKEHGPE